MPLFWLSLLLGNLSYNVTPVWRHRTRSFAWEVSVRYLDGIVSSVRSVLDSKLKLRKDLSIFPTFDRAAHRRHQFWRIFLLHAERHFILNMYARWRRETSFKTSDNCSPPFYLCSSAVVAGSGQVFKGCQPQFVVTLDDRFLFNFTAKRFLSRWSDLL